MSHNMEAIAARLRQAGYRVTPQRQLILDAVCQLGGHVTPEAVHDHVSAIVPSLNQATVYRTLHFLHEQGVLSSAQLPTGRIGYEIAGPEPHHHLLCHVCQGSIELPHSRLHQFYEQTEQEYGFAIASEHITFWGTCRRCRQENATS